MVKYWWALEAPHHDVTTMSSAYPIRRLRCVSTRRAGLKGNRTKKVKKTKYIQKKNQHLPTSCKTNLLSAAIWEIVLSTTTLKRREEQKQVFPNPYHSPPLTSVPPLPLPFPSAHQSNATSGFLESSAIHSLPLPWLPFHWRASWERLEMRRTPTLFCLLIAFFLVFKFSLDFARCTRPSPWISRARDNGIAGPYFWRCKVTKPGWNLGWSSAFPLLSDGVVASGRPRDFAPTWHSLTPVSAS